LPNAIAATTSVHKKFMKTKNTEKIALFSKKRKQVPLLGTIFMDASSGDIKIVETVPSSGFNNKYLPVFVIDDGEEIRTTSLKTRGLGNFANAIGLRSSNLIVVDGVVLPRQSMKNMSIWDVALVEALRGPQGTFFGQNASTGVIRYETKRPQIGEFMARVSVQATEYKGLETKAAVGLPLGEHWAARLNAQRSKVGWWIRNDFPGAEDIGAESGHGFHGQLLFDNDAHFSALLRMEFSERTSNCCAVVVDDVFLDFGPTPVVRIEGGKVSASSYNKIAPEPSFKEFGELVASKNTEASFQYVENIGFSAELNYTLDNGMPLNYLASYRDFDVFSNAGSAPFKFPLERKIRAGNEIMGVVQQELSLSSLSDDVVNWVVGIFYHDTAARRSEVTDGCVAGAGASSHGVIEDGVLVACVTRDSALAFIDDYHTSASQERSLLQADRNLSSANFSSDFTNTALYGQFSYQITPKFDATLGFRALYEKGTAGFTSLWLRPPVDGTGLESFAEVKAMASVDESLIRRDLLSAKFADSNSDFIYKSVFGYDFSHGIYGYLNYSTGYKGASFHVTGNTNLNEVDYFPTRPERSKNIELGLKTALFANHVLFDISYFNMAVEDFQVQAQLLSPDLEASYGGYINAEEVRSKGVEADLIYKIADNFKLISSYALFDADYVSFSSTRLNCLGGRLEYRCGVKDGKPIFDQTGLPLPNNSEEQLKMAINFKHKLGRSGWNADVRSVWRYESEKTPNTSLLAQNASPNPAFDVLDLYLGLGNAKLRFNLFFKNLLNERFSTSKSVAADGARVAYTYSRDYQRYLGGSASYYF
jgi:outer membrane receptor protein involved in Fe transport